MSEFDKWWKQSDYGKPSYKRPNMAIPENVAKAAYTAGLLRAAEIVNERPISVSMYATSNEARLVNKTLIDIIESIHKEIKENDSI